MRPVLYLLVWITLTASLGAAATGGNIIITGHDDDYHGLYHLSAPNFSGPLPAALQQMSQMVIFARKNAPNPSLPVLVLTQPGTHNADPSGNVESRFPNVCNLPPTSESYLTCSLAALGVPFAVFDVSQGVPPASLFDVTLYSAVGVPSYQSAGDDGDIGPTGAANIAAAAPSFRSFINSGGGVFAFASADNTSYYNFLPNTASVAGQPNKGDGFSPGPDSLTVAIPFVNGDATHNFFSSPGNAGMDPAWKVVEVYNGYTLAGASVSNAPATIAIENGTLCGGAFGATPTITPPLSPASTSAGGSGLELTITGSNLLSGDQVQWTAPSGSATTIDPDTISATQLTVKIGSVLLVTSGTATVTVHRPVSGSCAALISNAAGFKIIQPSPVITALSPSSAVAGGATFALTISGTNLATGAQAQWTDASGQTTTLTPVSIAPTQLTVNVDSSLIANSGTAQIAVVIPVAGSSSLVSNSMQLSISTLAITSVSPASASAFGSDTPITISGSGFQSGVQVTVTGVGGQTVQLTNVTVTPTQITATLPGSALSGVLSGVGTDTITVTEGPVTAKSSINVAAPSGQSVPNLAIQLASQPKSPTDQPTLNLTAVNTTSASNFIATLSLTFTPTASNLPNPFSNPGVSFSTGKTTLCFPVPAGPDPTPVAVDLSDVQSGKFSQGTVAGTIQIVPHLYYGTSCTSDNSSVQGNPTELAPASQPFSLTVAAQAPVFTTNPQFTNVTSSGFNVELNAYSTTRELTTISFAFTAASGTQLTGMTAFNGISVSQPAAQWFSNSGSLPTGGAFHLTVPFTYTGNTKALGSVAVTLANSAGSNSANGTK